MTEDGLLDILSSVVGGADSFALKRRELLFLVLNCSFVCCIFIWNAELFSVNRIHV